MDKPYAGLRIAGVASDAEGCGYYRIINPFTYAARLGAVTQVFREVSYEALLPYDIVVVQRQINPAMVKLMAALKRRGKVVIAETDDLIERVPLDNPAHAFYKPADVDTYLECIETADGVTVSTPELRYNYSPLNRNTYVLPNYIDFDLRPWPTPTFRNDGLVRLGWTGSASHAADIMILGPVLKELMDKYPNTVYVHYGVADLTSHLVSQYRLPADRIEYIPPESFVLYPSNLNRFDIGMAPLLVNQFNLAKSHLKVMEYAAAGVPFVASRVAPYTRYTDQGVDGYTAGTTDEWIEHLSLMIEDSAKRKEMAEAAYTKARERHDLAKNIHYYVEAWVAIRFARFMGDTGPGEVTKIRKVGRNDKCPCGSGLKYKRCCYPSYGS